jgi:peptidoglycan-associated lipoprotein
MMRASFPALLLISATLAACASHKEVVVDKHISQSGALKVHPSLLGAPVPQELQEAPPIDTAATAAEFGELPIKPDQTGLRTQRSVYFAANSSLLADAYQPVLQAHAQYLAAHPKSQLRIEGNADEGSTAGDNARLGRKRAEAVRQAIIALGATPKQLNIKTPGARPHKSPAAESRVENRRADIIYEKED